MDKEEFQNLYTTSNIIMAIKPIIIVWVITHKDTDIDGKIILRLTLNKYNGMNCSGSG
jgi:hypothetical protein